MFSLLWSEHCAYKHSKKLLRRAADRGRAGGDGAGRERRRRRHRQRPRDRLQGRVPQPPERGRALPGRGDRGRRDPPRRLRARRPADRDPRQPALRRARLGALALPARRRRRAGSATTATRSASPTVGGEIYFEEPYEHNCLVNAMCVGIAKQDEMVRAAAAGVGNAVVLMGASTGRDGIGGASVLASAELGEGDDAKRPTVQIGDPFEESKVLECCLELLEKGLLVSLQDLGAAGLTSSAGEMASAGGVGIDIDVGRVPLREADMEPFEIMVSESQERMLGVVEPAQGRRGARRLREMADRLRRRSARSPTTARSASCATARSSARCRSTPSSTTARSTTSSPAEPEGWIYGNRATLAARRLAPRRPCSRCSPLPQHRLQALGLRAVRLGRRLAHGAAARVRRRRRPPDPRGGQRDRGLDRRQRPAGRLRPLRRHGRGGARVRPEPRLRRRRAARPDQLPQLRQPREAGDRLAARPLGQRPRRRLRGARRPGRRRQRLALQRGAGRPDLPDPGGRHGRRAARPGAGRPAPPSPPRATRSARRALLPHPRTARS